MKDRDRGLTTLCCVGAQATRLPVQAALVIINKIRIFVGKPPRALSLVGRGQKQRGGC